MRRAFLLLTLSTLAVGASHGAASAAIGDLDLISRADGAGGEKGNLDSGFSAVSAGAGIVAFDSPATNLHPDASARSHVYARDPQAGTTALVSRAAGADGSLGARGSFLPGISADGRFVSFVSDAGNLDADDPDPFNDVYVRDLQADTTTLASRATGAAGMKGNSRTSSIAAISPDGRHVAFASTATNMDSDDTDGKLDVYVRDLATNTTTLVSRATGADGELADAPSEGVDISADGRFVAFRSGAGNLDPDDSDTLTDVFVRDVEAATTTLVSRATGPDGVKGNGGVSLDHFPSIAADGRSVAFASFSSNLHPDDTDFQADTFVRDLATNTTTLVSRATGAAGVKANGLSNLPGISADGRFVTFGSSASNLHPDDGDSAFDVYVRDVQANITTLISRAAGAAAEKGNVDSGRSAISPDGRYVSFSSQATNLHPDDSDMLLDVYRRDVLGPPPAPPAQPAPPPPAEPAPPSEPAPRPRPGCTLTVAAIAATSGDDERDGTPQGDVIFGLAGDDLLRGLAGADCLYGHQGADRLRGGSGRDDVFGGTGPDRLRGGSGRDLLRGRGADDRIRGGKGADRINPGSGADTVLAGRGNDRVNARGSVADTIDCGRGKRDIAIVDELDSTRRCERVRTG